MPLNQIQKRIREKLQSQKNSDLLRNPLEIQNREGKYVFIKERRFLNFASNDYLGIAEDRKWKTIVSNHFKRYPTSASSSRLVSGNYKIKCQAEKEWANHFGFEDAIFFPSGFQANLAVLSTLPEKNDSILFDKAIHASCIHALKSNPAQIQGYNHGDLDHLEKRLKLIFNHAHETSISTFVLTESLFSMDGSLIDRNKFKQLKKHYRFFSIVDEAHAFGALGEGGRGHIGHLTDIAVGTFGKALGFFGAFVLMSSGLKEYFFNFSTPLIYTTALPPAYEASVYDLLGLISSSYYEKQRQKLKDISCFAKSSLETVGLPISGDAHILSIHVGNERKALSLYEGLIKNGIFTFLGRYPTVPLGKATLRICMSALHEQSDVEKLVSALKKIDLKD